MALALHNAFMRYLGVTLTEIADLELLTEEYAADNQYAFVYAAATLRVAKAAGTRVNPVVIK